MKLSLPLLLVICVVGYGYSTQINQETQTKVICEDCEYTHLNLDENALDKIRLVKLQNCLVQKKRQINREEQEKKIRIARSANQQQDTESPFDQLFSNAAAFKRILAQYMKLKDTIIKKTVQLQEEVSEIFEDFTGNQEDDEEQQQQQKNKPFIPKTPSLKDTVQQNEQAKCTENRLTCDKPNHVLRIKMALLTSQNNQKMCKKSVGWSLNLQHMNESCYETIKTTKKLAEMCDGQKECEVSIATSFNTICDCTENKHMEVEYTCELDTEEKKQETASNRSKRSLYYRNDPRSIDRDRRYRDRIMDYYDRFYDYSDYYADDYCDYYDYFYDTEYYDDLYQYFYGFTPDYCNYEYPLALSGKKTRKAPVASEVATIKKNKPETASSVKKLSGSGSYGSSYGGSYSPNSYNGGSYRQKPYNARNAYNTNRKYEKSKNRERKQRNNRRGGNSYNGNSYNKKSSYGSYNKNSRPSYNSRQSYKSYRN